MNEPPTIINFQTLIIQYQHAFDVHVWVDHDTSNSPILRILDDMPIYYFKCFNNLH